MIKTAIIIPTLDRSNIIVELLNSLKTQSFLDFICVVWDSSYNSKTERIVNNFDSKYEIVFRGSNNLGTASQRNRAIEYIDKKYNNIDYFIFLDDDHKLIHKDTIKNVYDLFESDRNIKQIEIPGFVNNKNSYTYMDDNCKTTITDDNNINKTFVSWGTLCLRKEIFFNYDLWFPEAMEKFDTYAFMEVPALSLAIIKKLNSKLYHTKYGLEHNRVNVIRNTLEFMRMNYYNTRLLFDYINKNKSEQEKRERLSIVNSELNKMITGLNKVNKKEHSHNIFNMLKETKKEIEEYYKHNKIQDLFKRKTH